MYVVYGGTKVSVAQLSPDGLSQVKTVPVFNAADTNRNQIEGNQMYKINGTYYVLDDGTQGTTIIWKSSIPFGPYTHKILIDNVNSKPMITNSDSHVIGSSTSPPYSLGKKTKPPPPRLASTEHGIPPRLNRSCCPLRTPFFFYSVTSPPPAPCRLKP